MSQTLRCAVYTRKSTSEGLEQEFNTLDAQRESCLAYITSQKGEGWTPLKEKYDDGGFTGANIDRPALTKLIDDIKKGHVNCVVVYKVDRLSRSLLDFSKLLEFFDKYEVTFVSVTQNFNTKTSMGRLTLNILLSFAQFEREIISERTRDKMGAARMKGKWMGGRPPFGYGVDREKNKLFIKPDEAEDIKFMFDFIVKEKSIARLIRLLKEKNIGHREHLCRNEKIIPARPFGKQTVHKLLRNPLYIGKVVYRHKEYEGEHEPIISEDVFYKAQAALDEKIDRRYNKFNMHHQSLFKGLLYCKPCNQPMRLTYGQKKGKKYFYYVCHTALTQGYSKCTTKTVKQAAMEEVIIKKLIAKAVVNQAKWEKWDYTQRTNYLRSALKHIYYEGTKEEIVITLQNDVKIILHAKVKPMRGGRKKAENLKEKETISKDEYYAALSLQIKEYMQSNNISQKECAKILGLTPARISQVLRKSS